jgi:hypothetical protein
MGLNLGNIGNENKDNKKTVAEENMKVTAE